MILRAVSDLHLDFDREFDLPKMFKDKEIILILAGDCFNSKGYDFKFFKDLSNRFYKVLYVLGNHEYYGSNLSFMDFIKDRLKDLSNLHILNNENIVIDNYNFIGSTLWSNVLDQDLETQKIIKHGIGDFFYIKGEDYLPLTLEKYHSLHLEAVKFITDSLKTNTNKTNIVITHHGPSFQSAHPKYANSPLNSAFYSDLEPLIIQQCPRLWIHGHTHSTQDYYIDKTRIVCNPKGYGLENKEEFNSKLTIKLGEK